MDVGFESTYALPMCLDGQIIGVPNLFTGRQGPLSDEDVAVGQAMADIVTIG